MINAVFHLNAWLQEGGIEPDKVSIVIQTDERTKQTIGEQLRREAESRSPLPVTDRIYSGAIYGIPFKIEADPTK